jgi:predicted AAA+ superfamily ATPase
LVDDDGVMIDSRGGLYAVFTTNSPKLLEVFMEYYPRKIEEKLDEWINRREILIVKGPRQSGKTTLLLHLSEKYGGVYVTLEDEDMLKTF